MSIVITGATGQLGQHVIAELLDRGVAAGQIVALGRSAEKLATLAERGVEVRAMDYDDAATVAAALKGASKVLLISSSEVGKRLAQHRAVIDAAKAEGVELFAYTSIANAGTTAMTLAAEHQATEGLIENSGLPAVILRNGWYLENYTEQLAGTLAQGAMAGSAGEGKVSAATRADFATAAAAVLVADNQAGAVYELGGDTAFSMAELAATISDVSGTTVAYNDLPAADFSSLLKGAGVPEAFADILADSDRGIARGDLFVDGTQLSDLIGRPTTTMADAVRAAHAAL
ncbi:SDR family oxidoreductase [Pseudarthrobacter sp. PS3-L1]|uniref:SDR family oxidoreductase n=1 Tax=Pseudarthrobacter sp. PS3-L1 TaxID=3046207 RepID=UPI0024BAEC61|nr:SDR family oxidoreductase [Pseudarthrobacter sp. PS3-L1]MDJ0320651.1 SDR family oxidoreductase [Pseudarthrobacter sp. PS3-L1]